MMRMNYFENKGETETKESEFFPPPRPFFLGHEGYSSYTTKNTI